MKFHIFSTALLIISSAYSLNSEEVTILPKKNVPVNYLLEIHGDTTQKVNSSVSDLGKTNIAMELAIQIVQKEGEVPELVISPKSAIYRHKGLGITFAFDSKEIPEGNSPILQNFRNFWKKPIRLPLTKDVNYLNQKSEFFRMLHPENKESYFNFVDGVLSYIANGEHYQTGEKLWHFELSNENGNIASDGKVTEITPKQVVIDVVLNGTGKGFEQEENMNVATTTPPLEFTVNADAQKTIDRTNALIRNVKGKALIKIPSSALEDTMFRGGDLEVSLRLNLKAS